MRSNARWMVALAVSSACFYGPIDSAAGPDLAETLLAKSVAEQQAARKKDPAWKPSATEAGVIQIGDPKKPGMLKNFCLNEQGNILACFDSSVRIYSPEGELLKTLELDIKPTAISMAKDRSIFVGGDGRLLKLDASGAVLASAVSPVAEEQVVITEEMKEMLKEMATQTKRSIEEETARMKESLEKRRADVTGLAVTDQDVFMAVGAPSDFSYRVYRFDHALAHPALVIEKLRGCCGQMDLQAHEDKLWIAHNARHSIESRDRDGKEIAKFGKPGKVKATDFGGCCEPKNMRVLANGDILAAESGPPTSIKRFSADGKFKEVVAVLDTKGDCVRVTVEMSPDGSRYYMLDTTRDLIRVFKK